MKKFESVKLFQRLMIVLLVLVVIALVFIVPLVLRECTAAMPALGRFHIPLMIYCILCAVPLVWALIITISVCRELYQEDSFSRKTSAALIRLSILALVEAVFILIWGVILNVSGGANLLIDLAVLVLFFAAIAASLFCRVLAKIIDKALIIKEENEYTI